MTVLKLLTLKNKSKNYENKTFTCSPDGVIGTRFISLH